MSFIWPQPLVRLISTRRVVFFLGSGVSATSKTDAGLSPKTWHDFILQAKSSLTEPSDQALVDEYLSRKNYLLALEVIKQKVDDGVYRHLLDQEYIKKVYKPSDLHRLIYDLDSRLIITTNFDKVYETYCGAQANQGYKTIPYYSNDLVSEIRSDTRIILKAHGSIDEINRMVFTRSQYHEAKRDHPHFYELLKAIFLTNTIVFIGCGMDDPDVLLILEEVRNISKGTCPHYFLCKKDAYNSIEKYNLKAAYGLNPLEYGSSYDDLPKQLNTLLEQVVSERSLGE